MKINKVVFTMLCVIVVMMAALIAFAMSKGEKEIEPQRVVTKIADEEIVDECTEEYESLGKQKIVETNAREEKASPNCSLNTKIYYKGCRHTTEKYEDLPEKLVNCSKSEIQKEFSDFKIEKFSTNEVNLSKAVEGTCGEHYLVKENEGKVVIYSIEDNGSEKEYEKTGISTEYLTSTDRENIKEGIKVYGKQNLNQLIENFE